VLLQTANNIVYWSYTAGNTAAINDCRMSLTSHYWTWERYPMATNLVLVLLLGTYQILKLGLIRF